MNNEALNHLATLGDRTAGAGAGLGVFGWLLSSQFIGLAGLVVALIGVLISWHYKREANRRHSESTGWRQRVAVAIRSALLDNIDPNGVHRG